jgi:hypothetical protein
MSFDSKFDLNLKCITVTKHLCEPCPGTYIDILKTIRIVCKDPSHYPDDKTIKNKSNRKNTDQSKPINQYRYAPVSSLQGSYK